MAKRSTALKRIADTGKPLYDSLSNAQKARFKKLARMLRTIACALGTGMMALLVRARGLYDNEFNGVSHCLVPNSADAVVHRDWPRHSRFPMVRYGSDLI